MRFNGPGYDRRQKREIWLSKHCKLREMKSPMTMWCRNSCEARGPKSSAMPKPPRKPNSNRHCGALPSVLLSRTFRKTSRGRLAVAREPHVSAFGEEQGRLFRQPRRQSPSRSAVSSTRHRICCLVLDRSFAPGWFNASALRAISRERQAILEQRSDEEKRLRRHTETIRPSIRPDLNTICSSLKNEMGGKTFFRAFPL